MTTMEKISYEEVDTTPLSTVKEAIYISEDLGDVKSYQGIMDKYKEYRFEEHLENIRGEFECQSYSYILFTIHLESTEINTYLPLFSAILEIPNRNEIGYNISNIFNDEGRNDETLLNGLLKNELFKKIYIKAEMETKFYIYRSLDILNQYQEEIEEADEGDGEDNAVPAIIESCFRSDNCSICLSEKPNILFLPCLHFSICERCEETGKLWKCSVCRKQIERKIKI